MPPSLLMSTFGSDDIEADLRSALAAGLVRLHWQPVVACATGDLLGFEALARWDRPGHGPVPPLSLIPLIARMGLFRRFDAWLLHRACATAATWPGHAVSVNVSARCFEGPGLVAAVADALERSGLAPDRLELEVSEDVVMAAGAAVGQDLERLKHLGVRLSLDDFGAGGTSLGCLHDMPFDKLKLDRGIVGRLGRCRRTEAIVRAVLQMGSALGLTVCAEGVERADQLAILQAYGCDQVQGFLIGRPEHALPDILDFYDRLDRTALFVGTAGAENAGAQIAM